MESKMKVSRRHAAIFAVAAVSFVGAAASAGTATFVNPTAGGGYGYTNLSGIGVGGVASATAYGSAAPGEFSMQQIANAFAGVNFFNTNLTFTRIFDFGPNGATSPNIGSVPASTATDKIWTDGTVSIALKAAYAGNTQWLGTEGPSSTQFVNIKPNTGSPFIVPQDANNLVLPTGGTPFRFIRSNDGTFSANDQTSDQASDRMISFLVTGDGVDSPTYALFWEDGTDGDFNDLAVIFSPVSGGSPLAVPLPASAMMGLGLFAFIGASRARRMFA